MKRILAALCVCMVGISFRPAPAPAAPARHGQCYTAEQLTVLDKQDVTGGKILILLIEIKFFIENGILRKTKKL